MLVELAIGDAYGAGFEYASNQIVREQNDRKNGIQAPPFNNVEGGFARQPLTP